MDEKVSISGKTAIMVLCYNSLETTKKFLDKLYTNTYSDNFYLFILNNGSYDETYEYLLDFGEEYDNIFIESNTNNKGVIEGRNQLYNIFSYCDVEAEYICFLDNDQFVEDGWLEQHVSVLEQSEADIVGAEAWILSKNFVPIHQCSKHNEPWSYVGCGGMLMKKEVPENIGLFDERFSPCYFEDPDFCYRAIEAGYHIAWNYKAKIIHIPHQTLGNNTDRGSIFKRNHSKMLEKWRGSHFATQKQKLVEALQ